MTTAINHGTTAQQSAAVASLSAIKGHTSTSKIQTDAHGTSSQQQKRKQPPSIEVTLSQRALSRAAELEVDIYDEGENLYERQQSAIEGEAEIIERKPKIMTYKRNAEAVYINDNVGSRIFDFYV